MLSEQLSVYSLSQIFQSNHLGPLAEYDLETLRQLKRGELPFQKVHEMQSSHKDADRFWKMLQIAQESVTWDDKILLPYAEHLYVVEKPDKSRVVKCDCGHEFGKSHFLFI